MLILHQLYVAFRMWISQTSTIIALVLIAAAAFIVWHDPTTLPELGPLVIPVAIGIFANDKRAAAEEIAREILIALEKHPHV